MPQQKINIEIRKGLLEITAEPTTNDKKVNWSTFVKVTDFDVLDADNGSPIEEFHYFDDVGESVTPMTVGYAVKLNKNSEYLDRDCDLNGYLAVYNPQHEQEIMIYSRGEAIKKARFFNGKIEKATKIGTTE